MDILTNQYFGSDILKQEDYEKIDEKVNGLKYDNSVDIGNPIMSSDKLNKHYKIRRRFK